MRWDEPPRGSVGYALRQQPSETNTCTVTAVMRSEGSS